MTMPQFPSTSPHPSPWRNPAAWWFGLLTAGILAALGALVVVMLFGHTHEMNVGWEPPWGILVVSAHVLSLASAGLCLAVPILLPREWPLPSEVSQKGLMTAGLAFFGALGVAVVEVSQPVRLSFSAELGEGFVTSLYVTLALSLVFISLLGATCFSLGRGRRRRALVTALLAFGMALLVLFRSERMLVLFGHSASWLSVAVIPVSSFSALVLGGALLLLLAILPFWLSGRALDERTTRLARRLTILLRVLLGAQLLFEALALYGGAAWGGERFALVSQLLVAGSLSRGFWLGEVFVGLLLPLAMLLWAKNRPFPLCMAALLAAFGQFMFWHNLVYATQLSEMLLSVSGALMSLRPDTTPCLPKLLISLGSFCLVLLMLSLNDKLQPYRD